MRDHLAMVGSALLLLTLLGTASLPPAQAHIAHALVRTAVSVGFAVASVERSAAERSEVVEAR